MPSAVRYGGSGRSSPRSDRISSSRTSGASDTGSRCVVQWRGSGMSSVAPADTRRQGESEDGAVVQSPREHRTSMRFDDALADVQTETMSRHPTSGPPPAESLEQRRPLALVDAGAVIAHADFHVAAICLEGDLDGLALRGVLHRVAKKVDDDGSDLEPVGDDRERNGPVEPHG